jgi:hypothetical protein
MTKSYRVNGKYQFTLDFRRETSGIYTIHARSYPTNPHTDDIRLTHVNSTTGKVCVTQGKEPRSLDTAIAIGQIWCKGYADFIETGTFANGGGRVDV